ncbi:hypothetical protein GCM10009434_05030 [Brevundimonas olei]
MLKWFQNLFSKNNEVTIDPDTVKLNASRAMLNEAAEGVIQAANEIVTNAEIVEIDGIPTIVRKAV